MERTKAVELISTSQKRLKTGKTSKVYPSKQNVLPEEVRKK